MNLLAQVLSGLIVELVKELTIKKDQFFKPNATFSFENL